MIFNKLEADLTEVEKHIKKAAIYILQTAMMEAKKDGFSEQELADGGNFSVEFLDGEAGLIPIFHLETFGWKPREVGAIELLEHIASVTTPEPTGRTAAPGAVIKDANGLLAYVVSTDEIFSFADGHCPCDAGWLAGQEIVSSQEAQDFKARVLKYFDSLPS